MVSMPASPLYDRLTKVSELDYSDPDAGMISKVQSQITSIRESCTTFTQNTGLQGATQAAMTQWVADFHAKLDALETRLQTVNTAHTEARTAMTTAKSTHATLSPQLLHPSDYAYAHHFAAGNSDAERLEREYLENLAIQRNSQREAAAQAALDTMNSGVHSAASGFSQEAADANAARNSGDTPTTMVRLETTVLLDEARQVAGLPRQKPPGAQLPGLSSFLLFPLHLPL